MLTGATCVRGDGRGVRLGIEEPHAPWGNLLHETQNMGTFVDFPWFLIPGLFIFLIVFAFNFFGDGVRDALDPKCLIWAIPEFEQF